MRYLKIFCIMFLYLISLKLILAEFNNPYQIVFFAVTIFLFLNYIKMFLKSERLETIYKTRLEKQREYFVDALNHDLRIPVIAQLRGLELLRKEYAGGLNEAQKEMATQIEWSCRCVLNMVSLLINAYNIENKKRILCYEKFNMSEVVSDCFNELSKDAGEKNLTFEYDANQCDTTIEADKTELKNVIYNLLTNAICYSNENGKVKVKISANSTDNCMRFSVSGSENKNFAKNLSGNNKYTVIGQSIRIYFCKKVIEFHKGKIMQNLCTPSSFIFELPQKALNY